MAEEATPVAEIKEIVESDESRTGSIKVAGNRRTEPESSDMSQSYHEIFDTQSFITKNIDIDADKSDDVHVFYNEGEGRLESVSSGDQDTMSGYLTSKLVADSLMWQQTFRNDSSPSPDHDDHHAQSPLQRPSSLLVQDSVTPSSTGKQSVLNTGVLNDIERDARRLATDVDALVENLSCMLQSMSALTVEHVQTYRDGVCKTCDAVDSNIR